MKKMGLGRGLDALLPETNDLDNMVSMIAVTEIDRNPDQPRRDFDEAALQTLADSIRTAGVLQPLLVVEQNGRYRIVAGERRFRAARIAGLDTVPCIVRDFTAEEQMEAALIENVQREDLNPIEEAAAVKQFMDACHYTRGPSQRGPCPGAGRAGGGAAADRPGSDGHIGGSERAGTGKDRRPAQPGHQAQARPQVPAPGIAGHAKSHAGNLRPADPAQGQPQARQNHFAVLQ